MTTKDYLTDFTVERMAQRYTMPELRSMAGGLGFEFTHSPKKATMCKVYSDFIFTQLDNILSHLSSGVLSIIDDLVSAGEGKALFVENILPVSDVFDMLMIAVLPEGDDFHSAWVVMPDELREAIGESARNLLQDEEHSKLDEKLQCLRGVIDLYGFCPIPVVFNLFFSFYSSEAHESLFGQMISCPEVASCVRYRRLDGLPDMPMLQSPYVRKALCYPDDLFRQQRKELGFCAFSHEEALSAGKLPYPVFNSPAHGELRSFLTRKGGLSESDTDRLLTDMWIQKQDFESSPMEGVKLFTGRIRLRSLSDLSQAIELAMKFTNSIPCWALKGYSSEYVQRLQPPMTRPPKVVVGPGMRKAGYTDADAQKMANAVFYGGVAEGLKYKAGRNDPCPCGSGLKFKNCHGKGN